MKDPGEDEGLRPNQRSSRSAGKRPEPRSRRLAHHLRDWGDWAYDSRHPHAGIVGDNADWEAPALCEWNSQLAGYPSVQGPCRYDEP